MIKGLHVLLFNPQAEEIRAFLRDKVGLPFNDVGGGWLIFDVPEANIACHPADQKFQEMSFYCDDLQATVDELRGRGVEFTSEIKEEEWGLSTTFRMPGDVEVQLYQPFYGE